MEKIYVDITWNDNSFNSTIMDEQGIGLGFFYASNFYELSQMIQEYVDEQHFSEDSIIYSFCDMATMLKAYTGYVSLTAISHVTGINQTLLSHYANGLKKPRRKQQERIIAGLHAIGKVLKWGTCNSLELKCRRPINIELTLCEEESKL